jgi:hypothetical protein
MKHWIAWHPDEPLAYRGDTEAEAMAMVSGLPRYAGHGDWTRCRAEGWQLLSLDVPNPAPGGSGKRRGRRC